MPHADALPMSTKVGATIQRASDLSYLTDTIVNGNHSSLAVLQAAVLAVAPAHADQLGFRRRISQALGADGAITDSSISALTTVAGLQALTNIGSLPNRDLYGD